MGVLCSILTADICAKIDREKCPQRPIQDKKAIFLLRSQNCISAVAEPNQALHWVADAPLPSWLHEIGPFVAAQQKIPDCKEVLYDEHGVKILFNNKTEVRVSESVVRNSAGAWDHLAMKKLEEQVSEAFYHVLPLAIVVCDENGDMESIICPQKPKVREESTMEELE